MQSVIAFVSTLPGIPIEHVIALVALASLGLASFAIYVVFAVIRERSGK
jgi:hypothetical protein